MEHTRSVIDSDKRFTIHPVTRQIKNESPGKTTLIQHDHNSERFTFELPRYIEGHDMAECNKVEVLYLNIESGKKAQASGVYTVEDLHISEDDENLVVCSWLISGNSTMLAGSLNFLLRYRCMDETMTLTQYAWHTATYEGIKVSTGIDADERFEEEYVDIIAQWKASVLQEFNAEIRTWEDASWAELNADITVWKETKSAELRRLFNGLGGYVTPQMYGAIGDGVADDTAAFSECVENMIAYSVMYLPAGLYYLNEDIRFSKNATVISDGCTILNRGFYADGVKLHVTGVTFKDVQINAITTLENSSVTVEKCRFINIGIADSIKVTYQGCGIYAAGGFDIKVSGTHFERCHGHGAVFCCDGGNAEIRDCTFNDNLYRAVNLYGDGETVGTISGNHIEDCGKSNETGSAVGCNGIYSTNGGGVVAENNTIINSRENGIEGVFLKISGNYVDGTGVEYSTKPSPSTEGIFPYSTTDFVVIDNVVKNTHGCGIKSYTAIETTSHKTVANNVISNSGDASIELNSAVAFKNAIVCNNITDNTVKIVNGDTSNLYVGDMSKFSGKADLRQNGKTFALFHYFDEIAPFTFTNCTPTIKNDGESDCISIAYAQYASLRYKLPHLNGKQVLHITGKASGVFALNVFKNGVYHASLQSVNSNTYVDIGCFLNFDAVPGDEYEIRFNPSSGTMQMQWCGISVFG